MVAVFCMTMCSLSALAVIDVVGPYNQDDGGNKKPGLIGMENLFEQQHGDAQCKNVNGLFVVVVLFVTMGKRINPNCSGKQDHENFEPQVVDDIDAQDR